ncbi:MAG: hypothetical protein RJA63_3678 [Pseudomonadota bacterium]|jgi:cystathionine beta-lyase
MNTLFEPSPDRRHTDSMKWQRYRDSDVIPLWVADMDFATPEVIRTAITARLDHPVLGYAHPWPSLNLAVVEGIARDHAWQIDPEWIVWLPGVIPGFNLACRLAGEPGAGILAFPPVYPPILAAPANHERRLIRSHLVETEGHWGIDWEHFASLDHHAIRLLMLCNPHNPVGRVWTREELLRLGRYADHHDWLICSDDIHCGLVLDAQSTYRPIAALDESLAQRTITLMAPSKTWNIPALSTAFAVIPNAQLRQQFILAGQGLISSPNLLGLVATEAAYRHGDPWRQALLGYLRENARLVTDNIASMPGLRSTPVEATYLAWIDCRELNQARPQRFFEHHGVGLSDGKDFGMEGYVRLNFACSRSLLSQALSRMQAALSAG